MPERMIGGRYQLLDLIAAGGFGEVWRARDERLGVPVAVKRIKISPDVSAAQRAALIERAEREARSAAALRDEPNVVAVHDVVTEDGLPWVVMRLVDGGSLAQELQRGPQLDVRRALEVASGVLAALGAAHRLGIVHRDVKPANIMLTVRGQVLLADFGIAKHRDDTSLTVTGTVVGSLEYMAPERFGADPNADLPAGDLFSLGATLFEAVEGVSPFRRPSVTATMAAVAFEPHPPLRNAGPLTVLIDQLLAKDPSARPSADAAAESLRALAAVPTTVVADLTPPTQTAGGALPVSPPPHPAVEGFFDVVIESVPKKVKIRTIKAVRELTTLGLKQAVDLVDHPPRVVLAGVSAERASRAKTALEQAGAGVALRAARR
ncbi:ribosomal protein L7/L12 [Catenulispora subtropica]|uniref:non-specific serine/threonine protein kinase n=1 Tax=Catenulispora subtropica TaxID=450798 RepID=A0ABP5DJH5_9ACTN